MKKVHWLKHINEDHSDFNFCPMYEDEILTYKSFSNRPDIVFDKNTSDSELEKYNFYRVVANTVPNVSEQTLDNVKVINPIISDEQMRFSKIAPRMLHLYYDYTYLSEKDITDIKMEILEMAKSIVISSNIISKNNGKFSWKQRNLLHWILTKDTMSPKGSVKLLDESGQLITFDKKEITELVKEASQLRTKLEADIANIISDGKTKTLMEYYKMDVEDILFKQWNINT